MPFLPLSLFPGDPYTANIMLDGVTESSKFVLILQSCFFPSFPQLDYFPFVPLLPPFIYLFSLLFIPSSVFLISIIIFISDLLFFSLSYKGLTDVLYSSLKSTD